ncbi:LexA family protein [Vampirovibrio chlorellavorus]|uniref:LexA family protein n=1 Tax=Vampirovibrio chlorellavorus TaxID=758823 RepID=UPI0026EBB3BA|nr:S24 family peptidase [Vampirovibrio chlorellavorus]
MGDALARPDQPGDDFTQALADGYLNTDLNARFIRNKPTTFLCPAPDDGIEGIFPGDTLIVDRSLKPQPGKVILADIDGEYCLRRLVQDRNRLLLVDDKGYAVPRVVMNADYYHGTVTFNIHAQSW